MKLKLVNFDDEFERSGGKIIPTRETLMKKSTVSELCQEIFMDDTKMSFIAQCDCEHLKGNFFKGLICPKCKTECSSGISTELGFNLWIEVPYFAAPFLHPRIYAIFLKAFGKVKNRYLIDTLMGEESPLPQEFSWYTPGWNSFYNNFHQLMETALYKHTRSPKGERRDMVVRMLEDNSDRLFCRKVPIMESTLHLITSQGDIQATDPGVQHVVKILVDFSVMQYKYDNSSPRNIQDFINRSTLDVYKSYIEYTDHVLHLLRGTAPKKGYVRRNGMGSRLNFTCRSVIVPIVEPHVADELHMPWKAMLQCHMLECINLLVNRKGKPLDESIRQVNVGLMNFDQELYDILQTLILECPYKGIPVLLHRNPSIILGSNQLFFVRKILIEEDVLGLSPAVIKAPNADLI